MIPSRHDDQAARAGSMARHCIASTHEGRRPKHEVEVLRSMQSQNPTGEEGRREMQAYARRLMTWSGDYGLKDAHWTRLALT